jgi:AcrR family transcriptional regulator
MPYRNVLIVSSTTRQRLVDAAFALFEEHGFDGTTVDQIAVRAGLGRTTFFRHFGSKDEVVFPNHQAVLDHVDSRLATATPSTRQVALREAARIVLNSYLEEGATARARYRLTSSVPSLRARETASVQSYQRLFTRHLRQWLDATPQGALRAELLSAALVTAHNYVLRQWLREEAKDVDTEFNAAISMTLSTYGSDPARWGTTVVITTASTDDDVLEAVRSALESK